MTLLFLLTTLFFLIGTAFFAKVIFFSIQQDQWLDMLFDWQNRLERLGNKSGAWNAILYKAGGACQFCFGHAIALISFTFYVLVNTYCLRLWPHFETITAQCIFSVVWYMLYVSTSTVISTLTITRL